MSETFAKVRALAAKGEIEISVHGYRELAADEISVSDVIRGLSAGRIVEDYPDYYAGPCVLVLQSDSNGQPVHALWGIPAETGTPATLVTAYRPAPEQWSGDFMRRKP